MSVIGDSSTLRWQSRRTNVRLVRGDGGHDGNHGGVLLPGVDGGGSGAATTGTRQPRRRTW